MQLGDAGNFSYEVMCVIKVMKVIIIIMCNDITVSI